MTKRIDLTGQQFGRLTVISFAGTDKNGKALWKCICDCGTEKVITANSLRRGATKSCGCLNRECGKKLAEKYNQQRKYMNHNCHSRLYSIWHGMKQRCENTNKDAYKNYGARGILVCEEWSNSFTAFEEWSINNGYNEKLTIDRIDNNKGYSPENCRWATRKEQSNNTRKNCLLEYKGEKRTLTEWGRIMNIDRNVLKKRIYAGWSVEKALETPVKKKKHCP